MTHLGMYSGLDNIFAVFSWAHGDSEGLIASIASVYRIRVCINVTKRARRLQAGNRTPRALRNLSHVHLARHIPRDVTGTVTLPISGHDRLMMAFVSVGVQQLCDYDQLRAIPVIQDMAGHVRIILSNSWHVTNEIPLILTCRVDSRLSAAC